MAKDKISDYSATANSNTDIGGINIDEGCAPSGINDAIRTLMKQLKDWQSGSQDVYIHPAGSASVPSITATGDTNTGLFFPAADTVGITTGGSERARVDASGNLGLGVTPSAWGSSSSYKAIQLGGSSYSFLAANITQYIYGNAYFDGTNNRYINSGSGACSFGVNAGNTFQWNIAPSGTAGNAISFTQAMTLDASGSLGVGSTSPFNPGGSGQKGIEIAGSDFGTLYVTSNSRAVTGFLGAETSASLVNVGSRTNHPFIFQTNATERARIDTSGNFMVGVTSAPTASARGTFQRSGDCYVYSRSTSTGVDQQAFFMVAAQDGLREAAFGMYRNGSADACAYVNFVPTNGGGSSFVWSDTSGVLRIGAPSSIGTTGGTVIGTQTSDERLKTIDSTFPYGLETVNQLVPIKYTLNNETTPRLGFGAQTTQPVIPEVVYDSGECIDGYDQDPDNKMKQTPKSDRTRLMMDNIQIIPVLVKAIQEQQAIIEQLQADVAALKG